MVGPAGGRWVGVAESAAVTRSRTREVLACSGFLLWAILAPLQEGQNLKCGKRCQTNMDKKQLIANALVLFPRHSSENHQTFTNSFLPNIQNLLNHVWIKTSQTCLIMSELQISNIQSHRQKFRLRTKDFMFNVWQTPLLPKQRGGK